MRTARTNPHELFPIRSIPGEDGKRRSFNVISCSHCPEEATAVIAGPAGSGANGSEMLVRRWTRAGWYVGRVLGSHLCPGCNPTKARAVLTVVPQPQPEPEEVPVAREMTFADRRIINAKLEEVYENELRGYRAGWDDAKVAADLGTNVSWVEQLRGENFGPAEGNQLLIGLREEQQALEKRMEVFRVEGAAITKALADLTARIEAVGQKAA